MTSLLRRAGVRAVLRSFPVNKDIRLCSRVHVRPFCTPPLPPSSPGPTLGATRLLIIGSAVIAGSLAATTIYRAIRQPTDLLELVGKTPQKLVPTQSTSPSPAITYSYASDRDHTPPISPPPPVDVYPSSSSVDDPSPVLLVVSSVTEQEHLLVDDVPPLPQPSSLPHVVYVPDEDERASLLASLSSDLKGQVDRAVHEAVQGKLDEMAQRLIQTQTMDTFREVLSVNEELHEKNIQKAVAGARAKVLEEQMELQQRDKEAYQMELNQRLTQISTLESHMKQMRDSHDEMLQATVDQAESQVRQIQHAFQQQQDERLAILEQLRAQAAAMRAALQAQNTRTQDEARKERMTMAVLNLSNSLLRAGDPLVMGAPLTTPTTFQQEMSALLEVALDDPFVAVTLAQIPADLPTRGVMSVPQLVLSFQEALKEGRRAALVPEGGGVVGTLFASAVSRGVIPKQGLIEGSDPESVFARAEFYAQRGMLHAAAAELHTVSGAPRQAMEPWLGAVRDRLLLVQLLDMLQTHAKAASQ